MRTAFFLVLMLTLCSMSFTAGHSKPAKVSKGFTDSVIAEHLLQMKMQEVDVRAEDSITREEIDSLLAEQKVNISLQTVAYSPDSSLEILVFEKEYCGGIYCHLEWNSVVYSTKTKRELKTNGGFYPITRVYQMPDGKYLALEEYGIRAFSACGEYNLSALLFRVEKDSILILPAGSKSNSSASNDTRLYFPTASIQNEFAIPPYLNYDPVSKRLNYHHGEPCMYNYDSLGVYTGYMEYKNGQFSKGKETAIYTKP